MVAIFIRDGAVTSRSFKTWEAKALGKMLIRPPIVQIIVVRYRQIYTPPENQKTLTTEA